MSVAKGPKADFVRIRFAGQRHGEQRAAVKGVFKTDDRGSLGVHAGDLDGVFDGFRAGIKKNGFFRELAMGTSAFSFSASGNIGFVGSDTKAEVQNLSSCARIAELNARRAMADVEAADAAGEIDVAVTVYVFNQCAFGPCGENRRGIGGSTRDGSFATRHQRVRLRTGNFRAN